MEDYLGIDNLYEPSNTALIGYLNNAIKAKELFLRDKDYVVQGGEVLIVDEHTGRMLHGRRYNEGLHQAIEAKEGVEVQAENQTFATITLQNYFRMYDKLAGMTGTAETEAAEFMNTYKLGVIPIPTNRPMIRKDQDDLIFRTRKEKLVAVVKDVADRYAKGQPVLLGTASVEASEVVSSLLDVAQIPHKVLNAKHHEAEAAVVAVAGRKGAVTVATNMAGRGTDIMLGGNVEFLADQKLKSQGYSAEDTPEDYERLWPSTLDDIKQQVKDEHEEVVKLGGLYVLGTERHESRRIDNQLRGRSGRQGDPGESRFYLSLEDNLMRLFNTQLVAAVMRNNMPEGEPLEQKSVSKGVRNAQKSVEARNYEMRKNVIKSVIDSYVRGASRGSDKVALWDFDGLWKALESVMPLDFDKDAVLDSLDGLKGEKARIKLVDAIYEQVKEEYDKREDEIGADSMREIERRVVLATMDRKWREHLYEMDYLKDGIGLRGMGQRDPLVEYQREGFQMYNSMVDSIKEEVIQLLFNLDLQAVARAEEEAEQEESDQLEYSSPTDPDSVESDGDEVSDLDETEDRLESHSYDGSVTGLEPMTHEDKKVPLSKRPKSDELKTPWADGRTFPGTSKNAPCPCGSGRKYKMCHGQNEEK